jgi:hypothetical protein
MRSAANFWLIYKYAPLWGVQLFGCEDSHTF